ncbi:MAG: SMC-Scp complex subunit ScpB [Candidatus Omnitrophica bacterium]|nr:SMC-Scp complex subunit ScpB [Candidatus Omnitrophota bacterium]
MSNNNVKSAIEALLFASDKPLNIQQIKEALDSQDTAGIRTAIEELRNEYEINQRGIRIIEVAGGYQMVTAVDFAPFLKRLFKRRRIERLSQPALETLAIIAYKQPLTKQEIQLLRNVNVDGVIKHLLEKGLIRISGRKKAPGRPYVFSTTRQFLEYFGLRSLDDLPKIPQLNQELNLEGDRKDGTEKTTPEN